MSKSCVRSWLPADAATEPAGLRLLDLAARYQGPNAPSYDDAPSFKAELASLDGGADIIERGLKVYRPSPDDGSTAMLLHRLLDRQHYRLAHWRQARTELNYRRFFDINNLAGLRVEDAGTFRESHALVARLIAQGQLHGIRLDHIDGLSDPISYCRKLHRLVRQMQRSNSGIRPFYVVVEKILADGEALPNFEGVDGTTGYEWLNIMSRVLVNGAGLQRLEIDRPEFTDDHRAFSVILEEAKLHVLKNLLASEFNGLTQMLSRIAVSHYSSRDFGIDRLRLMLKEFVIHFPVYRTYVRASGASPQDRATIAVAINAARARWHGTDAEILDFLEEALTLDLIRPERSGYSRAEVVHFALKVQQFTGPMMAKSLEDTAFYRYVRLLALNEVGGDPDASALAISEFHDRMQARVETWPHGMTATATHDTKRGEDGRARVLAISDLAEEWGEVVRHWQELNEHLVTRAQGARAPSRLHEYMIYQTLIGAWPLQGREKNFADRIVAYALKATREGKVETSWTDPVKSYEAALESFIRGLLDEEKSAAFMLSFNEFAQRTALLGALNSLAQITLKATVPGVPDFYQGTELWDLSLVDPDNRRAVDFTTRERSLDNLHEFPDWSALASQWDDGRIKLALTHRLLAWRRAREAIFSHGDYRPLRVTGPHGEHVLAFARTLRRDASIVVVARHFAPFTEAGRHWPRSRDWNGTLHLDGFSAVRSQLHSDHGNYAGSAPLAELFHVLPVALFDAEVTL